MQKPKLCVFAWDTAKGGGSGFENLVQHSRGKNVHLNADIVAVVSNQENGCVRERADRFGIKFIPFQGPYTKEGYRSIEKKADAEFFALSGWRRLVLGLDPCTTFNIHPGPLPQFGGPGMYGDRIHEATLAAYQRGEITHTALCMHFVAEAKEKEDYDKGPIFFRRNIPIQRSDTLDSLKRRVNDLEHQLQPIITNYVVNRRIVWDGKDPSSLKVPKGYAIENTVAV